MERKHAYRVQNAFGFLLFGVVGVGGQGGGGFSVHFTKDMNYHDPLLSEHTS